MEQMYEHETVEEELEILARPYSTIRDSKTKWSIEMHDELKTQKADLVSIKFNDTPIYFYVNDIRKRIGLKRTPKIFWAIKQLWD